MCKRRASCVSIKGSIILCFHWIETIYPGNGKKSYILVLC
jgi:hypothetical protein